MTWNLLIQPPKHLMVVWTIALFGMFAILPACGSSDDPLQEETGGWEQGETEDEDFIEGEPEPEPGPVIDPATLLPDASACASDEDCAGGTCITGAGWADGYCTTRACSSDCAVGFGCVTDVPNGNYCALACQSEDDCRAGYGCGPAAGSHVDVCQPIEGAPDGEACATSSDCAGGFCLQDWPGGYCTSLRCSDYTDCSRQGLDNKCLRVPRGPAICVRMCGSSSDCRDGYLCESLGDGEGMCSPDLSQPLDPTVFATAPFDLTCGLTSTEGLVSIDYTIAPDTTSYMITPIARNGRGLTPLRILLPSGAEVDLDGANSFQSVPAEIYAGGMNPTIVPATAAHASQLEAGPHTYELYTTDPEVCYYVLEESAGGNTIDFNVYLVGIPNIDAGTAPTDRNLAAVLAQFDAIYGQAGVSIGTTRYFDVTEEEATRFSIIRSEGAVGELVALSALPGPSVEEARSVNIFFVRGFALGGAIGISMGLPGPAGLHGTQGSGVVFTTEFMGDTVRDGFGYEVDGNVYTGQVLAHEVGHYLGLFHTSEQYGGGYDPLADTPQCGRLSENCPDINNLMFPFAGESHTQVTPDQSWVIGVNPLTYADGMTDPTTGPDGTEPPVDPNTGAGDPPPAGQGE